MGETGAAAGEGGAGQAPAAPEEVLAERAGAVAVLTLNRPSWLNAFTTAMHAAYRTALAQAEADPAVGAIVVTGAGRGFCAGADSDAVDRVADGSLKPPSGGAGAGGPRPGYGRHPAFDRPFVSHLGLSKPVVAAVNGAAAGLGLVLACVCDVRFAAAGAKLTSGFVTLGVPAEYGLSWLLPRLIGGSRANELLLSGRVMLAEEAERIGLVHRVCAPEALRGEAVAYAQGIAERCAPSALAQTKRQLYADWMADLGGAFDAATAMTRQATGGAEFREGVAALRARRPPDWRRGS